MSMNVSLKNEITRDVETQNLRNCGPVKIRFCIAGLKHADMKKSAFCAFFALCARVDRVQGRYCRYDCFNSRAAVQIFVIFGVDIVPFEATAVSYFAAPQT